MPTEYQRYRVLWPLVPAMAMVMIDFTIVSISATTIQDDLHLSETAVQWLVTAYALSTAAFVALGGKLGDIFGHRRIVVTGVIVFALSSLMCGLVPDSSGISEGWLIFFRLLQGIGAGLLIPSATVLVLDAFPGTERGKGLAIFFIVTGLFTAIGPIAGSYLTEFWTWRAIFWINVPVALLALIEFRFAKLNDVKRPAKVDVRGAVLIVLGMGLTVLGIQQSTEWGWDSPATIGSVLAGLIVLAVFYNVERKTEDPLIDVNAMIANRPFAVDNLLTFLAFGPWLAVFFFGSMYFQVAVGQEPTQAGFSILTMFYSFFVAARVGGGWMDKFGAKKPVAIGFLLGTIGMIVWGGELSELSHPETLIGMLLTGAGFGLIFSPLNTDALNRLPDEMRGQGSGVIQTFRNFGSALGMAIMGAIVAGATDLTGAEGPGNFAAAMEKAWYVGAAMLGAGFILTHLLMPGGKQEGIE
ncbi:MAG TPA: MFS transporter [Solirubrobacterales bacterium]|jgi:EmrB/QacA subfamily drug resistance transporter|nr:MFS transporter [Solirubrobacterales bacterium]